MLEQVRRQNRASGLQGDLGFDLVQAGHTQGLVELRRVIGQVFEIVLEPGFANEVVDSRSTRSGAWVNKS